MSEKEQGRKREREREREMLRGRERGPVNKGGSGDSKEETRVKQTNVRPFFP